ncbi:hypothetical protein BJ508DRAFT_334743 [Ascobolus immersus RN42]|uniref:Uncharacterized protein n=1 Tax=Ascobolus immersus RN42 TaxID=1160509 RepID=A0A3N4HGV9_ASCIM|nr:hypothetical protein BJ508DRAFT_334743 [Ascobolus immersus RN42]
MAPGSQELIELHQMPSQNPSSITISTLLRWTDSFITIDRAFDEPAIWALPRLLSKIFLSRIEHINVIANTRLLPEAAAPELFARIYTMSLLEFLSQTSSAHDPAWLQAILFSYRKFSNDPIQTTNDIVSYLPDSDMLALSSAIQTTYQLPTSRTATDASGSPIRYVPPPPDQPLNFDTLPSEEEDIPGIRYYSRPLPDPPAFSLRRPDLHLDIGRNVSIVCPDGTQISTYDNPPTHPKMANMGAMMQQMIQQIALHQQALTETQEQARLALQQAQQPRHVSWQIPTAPEMEMRDRTPSPSPYATFGRRTPPLAFQQFRSKESSPSTSSSLHPPPNKFDDLHNQSPIPQFAKIRSFSDLPNTSGTFSSQRWKPEPKMEQIDADLWGGPSRPKVESVDEDPHAELRRQTEEMEQKLADARRQEQELERSQWNTRHASLADEYVTTMERIRQMQRLKEYKDAVLQPTGGPDKPPKPLFSSSSESPQDARLYDAPRSAPARRPPGADRPSLFNSFNTEESTNNRSNLFGPRPDNRSAEPRPTVSRPHQSNSQPSTIQMIDQFCDMMNKCGPAEAEHFRARAASLFPLSVSPPPPQVPGSWPTVDHPTSAPSGSRSSLPPLSSAPPPGSRSNTSAPIGSRSYPNMMGPQPTTWTTEQPIPQGPSAAPPIWNGEQQHWQPAPPMPPSNMPTAPPPLVPNNPGFSWQPPVTAARSVQPLAWTPQQSAQAGNNQTPFGHRPHEATPWHATAPPMASQLPWHASQAQLPQPMLSVVVAPPGFQSMFPPLPDAPTKRDRYHVSRVQVYQEEVMPLENWLASAYVDVYGYGEQAVCPLWGRHAFPHGSYLHLWFNALSYHDQLLLQVGDGIFRNWEYCLMMLRPNLDERLRTKADGRRKRPDETYPQYLAETYPLLKAVYRTDTEAAIIQRLKGGFDSWDACHAMAEEYNFQQLENQAHRYERMRGLFSGQGRTTTSQTPTSSYLSIEQARSSALPLEQQPVRMSTEYDSSSFAAKSSYQQQPANAIYRSADPADFVAPTDLHPDMLLHRLPNVPDDEIDPRAKTVNKRPSTRHGGVSTRSYIKAFPRKEVVFLARECSTCKSQGLKPNDHFNFEHNLYHAPQSKTYIHESGLPEVDQDTDSENEWEE